MLGELFTHKVETPAHLDNTVNNNQYPVILNYSSTVGTGSQRNWEGTDTPHTLTHPRILTHSTHANKHTHTHLHTITHTYTTPTQTQTPTNLKNYKVSYVMWSPSLPLGTVFETSAQIVLKWVMPNRAALWTVIKTLSAVSESGKWRDTSKDACIVISLLMPHEMKDKRMSSPARATEWIPVGVDGLAPI